MKEVLGKGSNNVAGADGVEAVIKSYNGHKYKSFSSIRIMEIQIY